MTTKSKVKSRKRVKKDLADVIPSESEVLLDSDHVGVDLAAESEGITEKKKRSRSKKGKPAPVLVIDDTRLTWLPPEVKGAGVGSMNVWKSGCDRYEVGRFFESADPRFACCAGVKMIGNDLRSLPKAFRLIEEYHQEQTKPTTFSSNVDEVLAAAETAGLTSLPKKELDEKTKERLAKLKNRNGDDSYNETDEGGTSVPKATIEGDTMNVSEKSARSLLISMGLEKAKDWTPARLAKKLNSISELMEGAKEPKGNSLKLLKSICDAISEGKTVAISDAEKAAAAPSTNGKAAAKKDAPSKAAKKESSSGPSNKEVVYKEWLKSKDKSKDRAEYYHKKVDGRVKLTTIKGWIHYWNKGDENWLPACAKTVRGRH